MINKVTLTILIILLPALIITSSIDSIIFNKNVYAQYETQVDNKEKIIINLLDYFKNDKEFIKQEGFTQKERDHFLDVKEIIRSIRSISLLSMMLTSLFLINLYFKTKKKELKNKLSIYLISGSSITILIVLFIYVSSQNFEYFFTLFHSVLFKTGTWTFPANSLSIKLFPLELFKEFAKIILTKITFISIILLFIGIIYKK